MLRNRFTGEGQSNALKQTKQDARAENAWYNELKGNRGGWALRKSTARGRAYVQEEVNLGEVKHANKFQFKLSGHGSWPGDRSISKRE